MLKQGSRYEKTATLTVSGSEPTSFVGRRPRAIGPATGVLEHRVTAGDRLDLLARHYYNDDCLWWRIVDANPEFLHGGDMMLREMEGRVILIPRAEE